MSNKTNLTYNTSSKTGTTATVGQTEIQLACVDLICKLESSMANARKLPRGDQVDSASTTANKILSSLTNFTNDFIRDEQAEPVRQEISKASAAAEVHRAVLKNRPWTTSLKAIFLTEQVDPSSAVTNTALRDSVLRAVGTTFIFAIDLLDPNSSMRQQVEQSSAIFLKELEEMW
jgi:hypothetical protein